MRFHVLPFTAAALVSLLHAPSAQALTLTSLPGVTTLAGSCYLGCGNPRYDSSNILDGDFGASGNNGLNAWNSGFYGGWVQVDFGASYVLDRIELYGWPNTYNPFTLLTSSDGSSWNAIKTGGYGNQPLLSQNVNGSKYGAVFDVAQASLAEGLNARFLRYSVNSGSPHWGYLFEIQVQGHEATAPVPEPAAAWLLSAGVAGLLLRRRWSRS